MSKQMNRRRKVSKKVISNEPPKRTEEKRPSGSKPSQPPTSAKKIHVSTISVVKSASVENSSEKLVSEANSSEDETDGSDLHLSSADKEQRAKDNRKLLRDRVIYARKVGEEAATGQVLDGEPIDYESACKIKELAWGSSNMPPKPEWLKQGIVFRPCDQLFAYGLKTHKNGTKNFLISLQAYFLKQLLFDMKKTGGAKSKDESSTKRQKNKNTRNLHIGQLSTLDQDPLITSTGSIQKSKHKPAKTSLSTMAQLLKPGEKIQQEMLVGGLVELLSKIADGKETVLCLPGPDNCFQPTAHFGIDGITEKLRVMRCSKDEELRTYVKKYSATLMQENGIGLISVLYSVILTRNFNRLAYDLQDQATNSLIDPIGDCTTGLLNLIITGRANPYLHNGIMVVEDEDNEESEEFSGEERRGMETRNDIGFLIWDQDEETTNRFHLGSRLKTPTLPIWITRCNGQFGVLFNPNRELMRSYHAENRFQLYYYSDAEMKKGEYKETLLTIDTRNVGNQVVVDPSETEFEEAPPPPLEKAIQTKWEGSTIDWGGITPYI
ncbi:inactive ubiquitin carboxyl-terminal hydrolase MINDY-4B-like isoform X4 [Tigriopus californicus]|uniref:inactive ubiquitin carboxyl-terminal hydrolase MINDY-4B-like isoform X4 n=1 Tax=Tigriopus californicus TaxID=6832 RepID=UPI0027DA7D82|nr:inactive ubiquitin carboxyl-terminal hydrolase MINDY-4B-like isoform X4 [Tigriopus californicus]